MNFGRIFAGAFVRRVAGILAVLLLASLGVGSARATGSNTPFADEGEAYYVCMADKAKAIARGWAISGNPCTKSSPTSTAIVCYAVNQWGTPGPCDGNYSSYSWNFNQTCSTRNSSYPPGNTLDYHQTPAMTCAGGCQISGTWGETTVGGVTVVTMSDRSYTGLTCSIPPPNPGQPVPQEASREDATKSPPPECSALGSGQTGCVKPNGDYCATASTGKTFCWSPTETGTKTDATDAQVKSKVDDPVKKPDVTIPDTDWQRKEGHQKTACVNGTCINYNVTNYQQVPGAGSAKNSTGNNDPAGSKNTSGNGKEDDKDGKSNDSASDSGNCDAAPACTADTLKCLSLKFSWKIQCHTQPSEVTNGVGCGDGDVPICAGKSCKAEAYSQLLQQWKQRCAFDADRESAKGDAASGASDGASDDIAGTVGGLWDGKGVTPSFNMGKVSMGGGQLFPDVPLGVGSWSAPPELYTALDVIRKLVIAAFMIWGFVILWRM